MIEGKTKAAKPFVKWAGGKGSLLPQLSRFFPPKFNSYFEPFVGGGAVFFSVSNGKSAAHINDINKVLIHAYREVKTNVEALIVELKQLESQYIGLPEHDRREFFYEIRSEFNAEKIGVRKTVLLLFLNKTCFNGLYRENLKGEFNVPFGSYANPSICNEDNLRASSEKLQRTVITSTSYRRAVKDAKKGDFVYLDPPYFPLNETSSFTAYHKDGFSAKDQKDLRDLFRELDERGCFVMLSNSDSKYIKELYKDYRQETVYAGRHINAQAAGRGKIAELVVLNY